MKGMVARHSVIWTQPTSWYYLFDKVESVRYHRNDITPWPKKLQPFGRRPNHRPSPDTKPVYKRLFEEEIFVLRVEMRW